MRRLLIEGNGDCSPDDAAGPRTVSTNNSHFFILITTVLLVFGIRTRHSDKHTHIAHIDPHTI